MSDSGAADLAWRAGAELLWSGARTADRIVVDELRRAVHAARADGLHRLARAGAGVTGGVAALVDDRADFALADLVDALAEWLEVARALRAGDTDPRWVGTARRSYEPVGDLHLWGLFSEPVLAGSFAGVVTTLVDVTGRLWQASDVRPGPAERAVEAYDGYGGLGGLPMTHRRLSRSQVIVRGATASDDGRLGGGAGVRAELAGDSPWDDRPPAALWETSFAAQLERAHAPYTRTGQDLLFVRARIEGRRGGAVVARVMDGPEIDLVVPSDTDDAAWRANLRQLAKAASLTGRFVLRLVRGRPRVAEIVAVGHDPDGPTLHLPKSWAGRANLGFDPLTDTHLAMFRFEDVPDAPLPPRSPLDDLRRRVERAALGGRATLPADALTELAREAARLDRAMMPTGAAAMRALGAAASRDAFAVAWLGAAVYLRATERVVARAAWS